MPILERNCVAHFAVRKEGIIHPLCEAWRSTWNWTLERAHVTCTHCRVALDAQQGPSAPSPS